MGPYRPLHVANNPPNEERGDYDDTVLALLLLVIGLARAVPAIWLHADFGAEETIALLMLVAGLGILVEVIDPIRWKRGLTDS